jgi:hypothetical protein
LTRAKLVEYNTATTSDEEAAMLVSEVRPRGRGIGSWRSPGRRHDWRRRLPRVEEDLDWADLDWAQFLRTADGEG